ncbi:MAG: hypothetical protein HWE11_15535 [Gammaproteobacteria bacterium]|nr:hypothetical protein [Gammaproteobacteria bacterium]
MQQIYLMICGLSLIMVSLVGCQPTVSVSETQSVNEKLIKGSTPVAKSYAILRQAQEAKTQKQSSSPAVVETLLGMLNNRQPIKVKMLPKFDYTLDLLFNGQVYQWEMTRSGFIRRLNHKDGQIYRLLEVDAFWQKVEQNMQ